MKYEHRFKMSVLTLALALTFGMRYQHSAFAQVPILNRGSVKLTPNNGNRLFNPYHVELKKTWDIALNDPVKLIAIGPVSDAKRSNLLMLIAGTLATDTQRTIRVAHWNDSRFLTDSELSVQSLGVDTLLLGRFHSGGVATPVAIPGKTKPPKQKKVAPSKGQQVLTNAGVYAWAGESLSRLSAVPPDVKLGISQEGRLDQMLVGAGDGTTSYEFINDEIRPSAVEPLDGGGFVMMGIGSQEFNGAQNMTLGLNIRYAQSFWRDRYHWIIGVVKGDAAPTSDSPNATSGDRIVIYTPKFAAREKQFWATKMDEMEEAWRSDPLPGRLLDVRVGDPKNEGKPGVLILTSENKDKDRHLYFFAISKTG